MADSTTTTTTTPGPTAVDESIINSWQRLEESISSTQSGLNSLNSVMDGVDKSFHTLTSSLGSAGLSLQNINNLTDTQANKFGLVTTALIGTRDAFKSFGNIDTGRLSTFTSQAQELFEILKRPGTAIGVTTNALESLANMLRSAGVPIGDITKAMSKGIDAFAAYAANVLKAADNQLRLQNAMLQLSTQAGDLATFYDAVGTELEHINEVSDKQTKIITDTEKATGLHRDTLEQYNAEILKVPGAFQTMRDGTMEATGTTNIFTKTIQFATGAGRSFREVTDDMRKAVLQYGLSAENSLAFTARMTEVAAKFGAQIDDVRGALNKSADAFKMFTVGGEGAVKITQGMSEVMNQYIGQLTSVGVPAQNAIEMFDQMRSSISGLRVEQKAFLSAQTGGPGGLMGAFQIDKMLKEGDIKGVYDKIQQQIKKQLGSIVTVDEAAQSQQAALQLQKQIMILRQGPLGQFAKTDQDAERLLEAMKRGTVPAQLGKEANLTLENAIDKGNKIQQLSYTEYKKMNIALDELVAAAGKPVLDTLQRSMTARVGGEGSGQEQTINQNLLKSFQQTGITADTTKSNAAQALSDIGSVAKSIGTASSAFYEGMKTSITQPSFNRGAQPFTDLNNLADAQIKSAVDKAQVNVAKTNLTGNVINNISNNPIPVTLAGDNAITVNVTSTCPHCGTRTSTSEAARLNPASVAK